MRLEEFFLDKLSEKVGGFVQVILKGEDYIPVEVKNDDDFTANVERFEFELFDFFRSNKITGIQLKNYPLTLPYSKSLVLINNLLAEHIDYLMDYW